MLLAVVCRTTTTTTHHHVPDVYPSKPTKRSASSFDMREKPTYNFKPSDYAAAARVSFVLIGT